mmetsp:Transcript_14202/g.36771  ORF Transcript_14202/g.36771 Transcript_14202/m.36771 type:complete len:216 (-) Transcript_14202:228-875(-)
MVSWAVNPMLRATQRVWAVRGGVGFACAGVSCAIAWSSARVPRAECASALTKQEPKPLTPVLEMPERRFFVDDVRAGDGDGPAVDGMFASVHYRVTIAATGAELDRTRDAPGFLNRNYGEPFVFEVGDTTRGDVIGAMHVTVRGMHVGGKRLVRMVLKDPDYGYEELPSDMQGRTFVLHPWTDVVLEVELVSLGTSNPRAGLASTVLDAMRAWFQ